MVAMPPAGITFVNVNPFEATAQVLLCDLRIGSFAGFAVFVPVHEKCAPVCLPTKKNSAVAALAFWWWWLLLLLRLFHGCYLLEMKR